MVVMHVVIIVIIIASRVALIGPTHSISLPAGRICF